MPDHQRWKLTYTASSIDRIGQKEADEIVKFFDEISLKAATEAVSILPNLPGFRPNSEQGVHRKVQLLARRLVGDNPGMPGDAYRDIDVLGFAWTMWGVDHLGDASIVNDYINHIQAKERDQFGDGEESASGDDPLALDIFEKLRDLSHANKCGRTAIKKFFEFSPFSETDRLWSIIESCKSTAEIARDKSLSTLPNKVEQAEQDIADLSTTVLTLSKHCEAHTKELLALRKDVETLQQASSKGSDHTSEIHKRLDSVAEAATAQEKLVQAAATSIKKLQNDHTAVANQINPHSERSAKVDEAITSVNAEFDQLRDSITDIHAIMNRVSPAGWQSDGESNSAVTDGGLVRLPALEKLRWADHGSEPATLQQGDEFVSAVMANLEALNIKKSSAEALALELIAALMAGQMPYFAGLSGKRVAEACAMALAANGTYVMTVPVGISAPTEFRRQLAYLSSGDRQNIGCVIIEGINRSAFDAFGECLIEMIFHQRLGDRASRSLLMMATLTDGPASLPLSVAHVSLGPVFHTDALDWRSRPQTDAQTTVGSVSTQIWEEAYGVAEGATPDSEEALRLLDKFAPVTNPFLRGTILSAFRALSALLNDGTDSTALQSLAFGWLVPVCIAVGATAEAVDEEFDQGTVDGTVPERRLANLLRGGIFNNTQNRGI